MNGELLWFLSRASGLVTIVLFAAVMVLGMLTAARTVRGVHGAGRHAAVVAGVHRTVALSALVFLALHIVTAIVDGYVDIGWLAALVPSTSGWEPAWVGLGTAAFDLGVTIVVVSLVRRHIPARGWRAIHLLSYLALALAVVHGLALAANALAVAVVLVSAGSVLAALVVRLAHRDPDLRARLLRRRTSAPAPVTRSAPAPVPAGTSHRSPAPERI